MWKDLLCGCAKKGIQYSEEWNRKVAKDSGHHYRLPGDDCLFLDFDGHCQVEQRPDGSLEVLRREVRERRTVSRMPSSGG